MGLWSLPHPTNTLTPVTSNLTFGLCWHHSVNSLLTKLVSDPTCHDLDYVDRMIWRILITWHNMYI
ncbi:hypothetical protein Hanom_Chr08g00713651 [Helianthus anomalus]